MKGKKEAHVYLPETVFNDLKEIAAFNVRSINGEITIAVQEHIARINSQRLTQIAPTKTDTETRPRR